MSEPKPLTQVREAISGNMYPQGPVFHWRDGWYFCRGEGMCVHIWNSDGNVVELTIPDAEWDSIVGFLSYPRAQTPPPLKERPDWPLPSFDAVDWAEAFCKLNPSVDQDLMVTWFANALMRGYDEHAARAAKALSE